MFISKKKYQELLEKSKRVDSLEKKTDMLRVNCIRFMETATIKTRAFHDLNCSHQAEITKLKSKYEQEIVELKRKYSDEVQKRLDLLKYITSLDVHLPENSTEQT